jgi:hypothetical protein
MRALAGLVALALASSARAEESCEPHARLEGEDAALIGELSRALEARGIRTTSTDTDEAWGCEELAVQVAHTGSSVSLTTRDAAGQARHRTVLTITTAVALMESWLMRGVGTRLPGARPQWWLTLRGEAEGAKHARWGAGLSATLGRDVWREVLHLELTLQGSVGSREDVLSGQRGAFDEPLMTRTPMGGLAVLCGPALRLDVGSAALWLGVSGGTRAVLGTTPVAAPILEPSLAVTLPVERDVELEVRAAFGLTVDRKDNGSPDDHWVLRGGVGLRWGLR